MRTIGSSSRRRGISSILGTIIFVGIMFTAVIPMFLVMNQADTLHEMRKFEVGRLDEERVSEDVYFYVVPSFEGEDEAREPSLTLTVNNRGDHAVKIIRVWINDTLEIVDCIMPPISDADLGPFIDLVVPDPLKPTSYQIVVVTDRGNIISPISGNPIYNSGTDKWTMNYFTIYIMMSQPTNSLHILVEKESGEGLEPKVDDDVLSFRSIYPISVLEEGTYHVTVFRHYGQTSVETLLDDEVVLLDLLKTSDVVWVPA